MTLVETDQGAFIADVDFGRQTSTAPLRLEQPTTHGLYRVTRDGDIRAIEMQVGSR